ncbi:FMN-dependent NADH-azoreductase [Deinococcus cellulosilyticus]|uniref:FMN dependent NADH:quinone oxidoreductase n=1 Tax=Deinococcus cellulosilyticus (strain DSM 18568 / NBRC 106333 / KACC 11606 / 5516J-15) TaxID=1223518 RepID=A0A511MYC1_DEIC1|nr:FMN-dependent NADH-azoreductase [Deinococcus cellulosilyticus]GEM45278.1 FMN-dependent NADH-azoreductase [Deinococcus cellulosilyticus NBRC 106333 = KACC 11606]
MAHILHLDSSARTTGSYSRQLTREFVETWLKLTPQDTVTYRDLNTTPLPFIDQQWISAVFNPSTPPTAQEQSALTVSDLLIDELMAADVLVFGVPIYNFSVPASFKAYLDQVIRMGRTARFTSSGPEGLVKGKQAYVITASGSDFSQEPFKSLDHHTPYIKTVLNFIGITDVTFIRHHGYTPEAQQENLAAARKDIETLTREGQLTSV